MPQSRKETLMLYAFCIALIVYIITQWRLDETLIDSFVQNAYEAMGSLNGLSNPRSQAIGDIPAINVFENIYNSVFFKHFTGVREPLYDYLHLRLTERLNEARNIDFAYDRNTNQLRRRRPCKLDNNNRIVCFLHGMRTGDILWNTAYQFGWNITSVSMDFFHVLFHFVDEFYDEWVCEMTPAQKQNMAGMFEGYPLCYQTLDGSQFLTTKSTTLPEGVRRREVYCWKHRWPQGKNVQTVVSHYGHATEVVIGPGAANDAAMSESMCIGDGHNSTLVDDGYPAARPEFILPDGSDEHTRGRTVVERYFSRLKMLFRMVGGVYVRGKRWHDLVLRAAFILTNMIVMYEGSLNPIDIE